MLSMLLAVSVGATPATGAVDRTGQGRVVISCASPGDVMVAGKRRGRCKEDNLKAAFWIEAGTHHVVVAPGGGAESVAKTVVVVEGRTVRVNLSGSTEPAGGIDEAGPGAADEQEEATVSDVPAAGATGGDAPAPEAPPPMSPPPEVPPPPFGPSGFKEPADRGRPTFSATPAAPVAPSVGGHRFVDRGNGTVADTESGLMWVKQDSYAELGRCLNPYQAATYVQFLTTGGHRDWRLPTALELATLAGESTPVFAHDQRTPLYLNAVFGDRASVRAWTAEQSYRVGTALGLPTLHLTVYDYARRTVDVQPSRGACLGTGVRAVRNAGR